MAAAKGLTFDVLIEIPKGSRNKYEYDFALHKIRFDRMLFSSMMYPGDYGFVPETLALDKDPLDVLVMSKSPQGRVLQIVAVLMDSQKAVYRGYQGLKPH